MIRLSIILLTVSKVTLIASEYEVLVPSDPKAKYYVLEKGGTENNPTLTTKRVGASGTSFSKRVFDCKANTFKYLGDGDTIEEMNRSKPGEKMSPLVEGSIAWHLWKHACRK
jgi:hypothetical protein